MGALQQFVRRQAAGACIGLSAFAVSPAGVADAQVEFVGAAAGLLAALRQPVVAEGK